MASKTVYAVLAACLVLSSQASPPLPVEDVEETPMLQMFDAMQQLMTGEPFFDRIYYQELRDCMNIFNPLLTISQDNGWQGIIDYWLSRGTESDVWGDYQPSYSEKNVSSTNFLNMTIYEPCDYASNVAYAHPATEICRKRAEGTPFNMPDTYVKALGGHFASHVMASSFLHMSHTHLGGQQDNWSIRVLAYLIHQGSIVNLPASPIVREFSFTERPLDSLQLAAEFQNMYSNLSVTEWYDRTASFDIPDYYLSFAGIFINILTLVFPEEIVDQVMEVLMPAFGLEQEIQDFLITYYVPEIRNLTADIDVGIVEETRLLEDGLTTAAKLIYAFLWQEQVLTSNPIFLNETVIQKGYELLPVFNSRLNEHNTYEYFDLDFQNGRNVYPGDFWCNNEIAHSMWHLESAIGMLDLSYMADEMYKVFLP